MDLGAKFESGLEYTSFLEKYGTELHRQKWATVHQQVVLTPDQTKLLGGFVREMKVMVLAGTWCGDCVSQCPVWEHFAAHNSRIRIRYFDRDANRDLGETLKICGNVRVPTVLFLNEDNFVCSQYGDRTLSIYRDMAVNQLGPSCPTGIGGVNQELLNAITREWLAEFERIQLMLRLSARLRDLHGD